MRILHIIGAVVCIGLALALWVPAGMLTSQMVQAGGAGPTATASIETTHTTVIISFGSISVTGWQTWLLIGGLALAGVLLVLLALLLLNSRPTENGKQS
jgi:hypothetical protein